MARSLIAIFIPVFMLETGYSIQNIILYYLVYNILDIPLNFVAMFLVKKVGARGVMIIGTLTTILFFIVLGILPPNNIRLLLLLATLAAVYDTTYWVSHIYVFYDANNKEHLDIGKSVGGLLSIRELGSLIGPALGAIILLNLGNSFLVYSSVAIFLLSVIPLFKFKHINNLPKKSNISFKNLLAPYKNKRNFLSVALWGIHGEINGVIWPLFIYILYGTIESIASIPILVSFSTIVFAGLAGKISNKHSIKMVRLGCFAISTIWLLRIGLNSQSFYYISILLMGAFSLLVNIPLDRFIVKESKNVGALISSTYRNTFSMSLRAPLYLILYFSADIFKVSFLISALGMFILFIFIRLRYFSSRPISLS